jgi:hypothetical protein
LVVLMVGSGDKIDSEAFDMFADEELALIDAIHADPKNDVLWLG